MGGVGGSGREVAGMAADTGGDSCVIHKLGDSGKQGGSGGRWGQHD